jgi:hypothetical protein
LTEIYTPVVTFLSFLNALPLSLKAIAYQSPADIPIVDLFTRKLYIIPRNLDFDKAETEGKIWENQRLYRNSVYAHPPTYPRKNYQ